MTDTNVRKFPVRVPDPPTEEPPVVEIDRENVRQIADSDAVQTISYWPSEHSRMLDDGLWVGSASLMAADVTRSWRVLHAECAGSDSADAIKNARRVLFSRLERAGFKQEDIRL